MAGFDRHNLWRGGELVIWRICRISCILEKLHRVEKNGSNAQPSLHSGGVTLATTLLNFDFFGIFFLKFRTIFKVFFFMYGGEETTQNFGIGQKNLALLFAHLKCVISNLYFLG